MSLAEPTWDQPSQSSAEKPARRFPTSRLKALVEWTRKHRRESAAGVVLLMMLLLMLDAPPSAALPRQTPAASEDSIIELFAQLDADRSLNAAANVTKPESHKAQGVGDGDLAAGSAVGESDATSMLRIPATAEMTDHLRTNTNDAPADGDDPAGRIRFSGLLRPAR
jgi:hypothetical protein